MYPIVLLLIIGTCRSEDAAAANKTKRTVATGQVFERPTFYDFFTEPPKVAAQQVLYEFQQTPTNAVSNVHVNQFYQPKQEAPVNQFYQPKQDGHHYTAESVATPVQHSALIRHGQNYAQVQFHPLTGLPQQGQPLAAPLPQQGRYIYVNGKIIYQPNPVLPQPIVHRPLNYVPYNTQKFAPPQVIQPMRFRFNPPQPSQIQQITKPMDAPEVVEKEEPEEEEEEVEEEGEEEFEDDEHDFGFEDEEHEEEDDDDSDRGSSKQVVKKHKKKVTKPNKYNNYKYKENYSSSSKYGGNAKKVKKAVKNPKKMKYGKKPKVEMIVGRQSQNVPVVHKQKIFKEKWYVTKSTDDDM